MKTQVKTCIITIVKSEIILKSYTGGNYYGRRFFVIFRHVGSWCSWCSQRGTERKNHDTDNRLICYDILDLGKQLMPIGMLVVLDSILNRITQNRAKGKQTFIFIDEIYLLFQHEYSANFLFTLWKRVRKYGAYATGITQNVDDLLQSHTARTMLANSEFLIMLNQASTDRIELAKLLNISDLQLSYITNVDAGHGLIKVGSSLVPFANKFPKNTKLYKLMTTKPGEGA